MSGLAHVIGRFAMSGKRSVSESLSAFRTSSLENVSAVSSSHSLSETVLLLSLTLFGLVSSEHGGTSLIFGIGSVSDSDPMDAFYSDIVYYTRKQGGLSSVFSILGKNFRKFRKNQMKFRPSFGIFTDIRTVFAWQI